MAKTQEDPIKAQASLHGREKEAVKHMAEVDGVQAGTTIGEIVKMWVRSEEGKRVLKDDYGWEFAVRETVVYLDDKRKR